jgi:glyoxylase-like metal-dependent hydrolase (beta-lactamase superfamily II)
VPGVRVLPTPGHTPHHQSVLVESAGEVACFLADLVPTAAHLPLPWIMGYDVEPLVTLESKRTLLARARQQEWLLVFEHDPEVPWGRLETTEERPTLVPAP